MSAPEIFRGIDVAGPMDAAQIALARQALARPVTEWEDGAFAKLGGLEYWLEYALDSLEQRAGAAT